MFGRSLFTRFFINNEHPPVFFFISFSRCRLQRLMMMSNLAVGLASFLLVVLANASEHELPGMAKFGYLGSIGSENWGNLSPQYATCSEGKHQSPINIVRREAVVNRELQPLLRNYTPSNATLVDNGFNIMLKYGENVGTMTVDGKNYTLEQMHWHTPSEHTIDGQRFAAELHLVHRTHDGNVTVIAILYKYGRPDPFIQYIRDKVDELAKEVCSGDQAAQVNVGMIDTKTIRPRTPKYYRYVGSLTTPPCSENVIWNVLRKVRHISYEQVRRLMAPLEEEYHRNSRPTQPLNGRKVWVFKDGCCGR